MGGFWKEAEVEGHGIRFGEIWVVECGGVRFVEFGEVGVEEL